MLFTLYTVKAKALVERCPSGLKCSPGTRVCGQTHRGFKSHSLRQDRLTSFLMRTCQLFLYPCGFARNYGVRVTSSVGGFEPTPNRITQNFRHDSCNKLSCFFNAKINNVNGIKIMNYIDKSTQITEGLRKSFQSTDCKMANRICYGYTTAADGELAINEVEANVVRSIFKRYLGGDSFGKIATALEKQGIQSPTGKAKWNREAISKLLSNEKYTGSVLLQKTMSFAGAQFQNDGELDQVLIKGHHEPIIALADFERVRQLKNKRSKNQTQDCDMKMSF